MYNAIFSIMSIIPLFLYNEKRGPQLKYIFYWFYPIHLLILGLINVLYRLDMFHITLEQIVDICIKK
jgi:hypothetical protein